MVQGISQRKNCLHDPFQFDRIPNLLNITHERPSESFRHKNQSLFINKRIKHASSDEEFTIFRFLLSSETYINRGINASEWKVLYGEHKSLGRKIHYIDFVLTCVWNCILNAKTLSLDSTRGTFISSKKNCQKLQKRPMIEYQKKR